VSRWMTWLPISLKNAAKCDKWYQLQNHSITESLNANGAREKPFMGHPRACRILSVEHVYKKRKKLNARVLCSYGRDLSSFPIFSEKQRGVRPAKVLLLCDFNSSQKPSCEKRKEEKVRKCFFLFSFYKNTTCVSTLKTLLHAFVSIYRPEYGRTTRRT